MCALVRASLLALACFLERKLVRAARFFGAVDSLVLFVVDSFVGGRGVDAYVYPLLSTRIGMLFRCRIRAKLSACDVFAATIVFSEMFILSLSTNC